MKFAARKIAGGVELGRKHVAALRALSLNPAHTPVDGMCLDELRMMALIRPAGSGYALTAVGQEQLQAELTAAEEREQKWSAGAAGQLVE
ncbi:MAG: hypothetical protein HYU58_05390 [Proteobacteria bacterium]|nr:hypothetical protein [Pseudomonadota bacterium]